MSRAIFQKNDGLDASTRRMVNDQAKKYEMWHQKPVKKFVTRQFSFPPELFLTGRAINILYLSDKWEKDGEHFPYTHDFSSRPNVYRKTPKTGAPKDTRALLNTDDLHGVIPMVQLATVQELVVEDDTKRWTIAFSRNTPLMTLLDMKTLVILHTQPIIIRGGKMTVRAPGITR